MSVRTRTCTGVLEQVPRDTIPDHGVRATVRVRISRALLAPGAYPTIDDFRTTGSSPLTGGDPRQTDHHGPRDFRGRADEGSRARPGVRLRVGTGALNRETAAPWAHGGTARRPCRGETRVPVPVVKPWWPRMPSAGPVSRRVAGRRNRPRPAGRPAPLKRGMGVRCPGWNRDQRPTGSAAEGRRTHGSTTARCVPASGRRAR